MTPAALLAWYRKNRARTRGLFDLLSEDAYYSRPIALRHPIVFYEGHLPAFSFNTLIKNALGRPSIDVNLERLFARGIDPHESTATAKHIDETFDVNVKGTIFTVQKALPLMCKGGSIMLTGSSAGTTGAPAFTAYSASKAAVRTRRDIG